MFPAHDHAIDHNNVHVNDLRLNHLKAMRRTHVRKRAAIQESPLWQAVTGLTDDRKAPEERA
jgi:hypothetical protein